MKIMYIDPGTGSMLISALIALISVGFFMLKGFVYQKLNIGGDDKSNKGSAIDLSHPYGLVFYSEGKQYWNVFKPLLEECDRRSIKVTYFTSDEDDPGLSFDLEYMESQYIGSGREAYFVLNRMTADMLVMTTPGLDVLEIKRNKNIKHYSHIIHSPGSIAGYKAYSVDYFDSVLLGGDGDLEVIRELEEKRNLYKKELKIIGHTYLDEYRKKLSKDKYKESFFDNEKAVVLLSPTWGNHGLLTKYGEEIISSLEKSGQCNVIIRPHPQSFISEEKLMEKLMNSFPDNENRVWDRDVDGLISMSQADIMISDFSGIIFDFAALFQKPILTMHGHYEKRGRDVSDIERDPWDINIVESLGRTIRATDIKSLPNIINESITSPTIGEDISEHKHIFDKYPGESTQRGVDFLAEKLIEIRKSALNDVENQPVEELKVSNDLRYRAKDSDGVFAAIKELFKGLIQPNSILQVLLALFLLMTNIYLGQILLPSEGLNQEFLSKLLSYSAKLSIIVFSLLILSSWIKDKGILSFRKTGEAMELKDIFLLALPLTPIVQYIIANQDILSFVESAKVVLFFFVVSVIVVLFVPFILSPIVSKSLTIPISLGFLFIMLNMASFGRGIWLSRIGMILGLLFIAFFLLLYFNQKNILIVASVIFLLTNIGTSFFVGDEKAVSEAPIHEDIAQSRILEYTSGRKLVNSPDVFFLVYESYSNQETMDLYGYDNSEQSDYLLENGFAIYDGTYSLGPSSMESIARVLEPDYIESEERELREVIASDAGSLKLFNNLDYVTHMAISSDYMTKGFETDYDYVFPDPRYSIDTDKIIIEAILEGEFRFDADFSSVEYEDYVDYKQQVLSKDLSKSEFLYTHNDYPGHSQNSGVLRPDETDLHIEGIIEGNKEMRADIEAIQLENRDAIIIIAGDHGPYLTKNGTNLDSYELSEINRMDIQDRYGSFLAIHWPDSSYEEKYDIQILQDVLPAVVSYLYEDDSLFDKTRMERETVKPRAVGGAAVKDGIIVGGEDDGLPLFDETAIRSKNLKKSN